MRMLLALILNPVILWAAEKPLVVPLGEVGGSEVAAGLPSEKVLILLAIAIQIIFALVRFIFERKVKADDESSNKLDRLFIMVHSLQATVKDLPTEDDLVKRIKTDMELIALKTTRREIERLERSLK